VTKLATFPGSFRPKLLRVSEQELERTGQQRTLRVIPLVAATNRTNWIRW